MVPRDPGEFGGEYFRVIPEGTIKAFDGLSITVSGKATVRNSVASGNSEAGYLSSAIGPTGGTELTIEDSMAVGNGIGVRAEGFSGAKGIALATKPPGPGAKK